MKEKCPNGQNKYEKCLHFPIFGASCKGYELRKQIIYDDHGDRNGDLGKQIVHRGVSDQKRGSKDPNGARRDTQGNKGSELKKQSSPLFAATENEASVCKKGEEHGSAPSNGVKNEGIKSSGVCRTKRGEEQTGAKKVDQEIDPRCHNADDPVADQLGIAQKKAKDGIALQLLFYFGQLFSHSPFPFRV